VSTRASLRNTLLVRSSLRHLGCPSPRATLAIGNWHFCSKKAFVAAFRVGTANADQRVQRNTAGVYRGADIKLNKRHSLPHREGRLGRAREFLDHVRNIARSIMLRYSAYGSTKYRVKPSAALSESRPSPEVEYRELLELRERVREAQAAAQRLNPLVRTRR
jgi:hypothetical protein